MARIALGLMVRTGKAAVVALRGPATAPAVIEKAMLQVAFTFEDGAVFHAAAEMPAARARAHVEAAEARFTKLARQELAAFAAKLGAEVAAARLAAPPAKPLPPFETIVKSHPLVHAAEIELYRRVFTAACAVLGATPARVAEPSKEIASALGWTAAQVEKHLAAMGKAAGRPWAAAQKQAALAGWRGLLS